jgi:hypothetical protein
VSTPRPRILIGGGGGERKTLRFVAQYADACNRFATSPEDIEHKLDVPREHCDAVGRDYAEITKTAVITRGALRDGVVDGFAKQCEPLAKLGIDEVHVIPTIGAPAKWIDDVVAPVVRKIADL